MTDPKLQILELLKSGWNLPVTPKFTADWSQEKAEYPTVIVSHVYTAPRSVGFSENPSQATRRFNASYHVDVWSKGDHAERWEMQSEVDRILHSKCNAPGGGLEYVEVTGWRDLDEGGHRPPLYRSRGLVEVLYYG